MHGPALPTRSPSSRLSDQANSTNYDAALGAVTTNWGASGPTAADQTLVYFISDGMPTVGNDTVGIVGSEIAAWENFLHTAPVGGLPVGVDVSYAVGIDTGVSDTDLTPIAWAEGNPAFSPILISNASSLAVLLQGSLPGNPSGNILSNDGFGADGGFIKSITIEGVTFTYNPVTDTISASGPLGSGDSINANGKQITVMTEIGGRLIFNFADNGLNRPVTGTIWRRRTASARPASRHSPTPSSTATGMGILPR